MTDETADLRAVVEKSADAVETAAIRCGGVGRTLSIHRAANFSDAHPPDLSAAILAGENAFARCAPTSKKGQF